MVAYQSQQALVEKHDADEVLGGTGHWPVLSGYQPDSLERMARSEK